MKKAYAEIRRDGSDVCGRQPGVRHLPNAGSQGIREDKLVPSGESEIRENKRASSPRKRGSILTFKNQWIPAFAGMTIR